MLKIRNINHYHHYLILVFRVCYLPMTCVKLVFISQSKPFILPISASIIQFRNHYLFSWRFYSFIYRCHLIGQNIECSHTDRWSLMVLLFTSNYN